MPFTAQLNAVPTLVAFILPYFTQYNAFPNSLTGAALDWYMELQANSIDSYTYAADAFIAKYSTSITTKQDERALMHLQQAP
ncbi:hypothetical protein LIER_06799 [Lithospermum erythrorhizon]|uniref:Retrotransposon gag domain-containing protein n=1 Tax=Lithospermum erythrorhizon TaxID=34254 RepID=A0AAV3P6J9_LITER